MTIAANDEDPTVIQDFSGGLNTLIAPNRLSAAFSPSANNCWNDDGALQKRNGQLKKSTVGGGDTILGRGWYGYSMHVSVFSGAQAAYILSALGVARNIIIRVGASDVTSSTALGFTQAGTASFSSSSTAVTGVGTNWLTTAAVGALFTSGTTVGQILLVNSDTSLTLTANFGITGSGSSFIVYPSWGSTKRVSFVDINATLYICGPGSPTISYDGTTLSYVSAFPQANYSITMANYVFAANTAANPSRIFWSALKDATTWPALNVLDVNPSDGFPIVGLFYDGQSLIILKTNSVWKLTGNVFDPANPTYTLTQISTPNDFVINSPKSIQFIQQLNAFIMLGQQGFYAYGGGNVIQKLFQYDIIRSEFAGMGAFNWGNVPTITAEPCSSIVDGSYWVKAPLAASSISGTDKELTYVIDKSGAIWRWNSLGNGIISDMLYMAGTLYGVNSYAAGTTGFIQLNTGSSDAQTSAISATYITRLIQFKNQRRFGLAYVYYKKQSAGNLTFSYSIDEGAYTDVTIDMTTGTGTRTKSAPVLIGLTGYSIQFKCANTTAAQTFEVYGIEFDAQELRQ